MSVSERIVKRREELGFSQTELAKRAGLKPPAISQYESGARNPSYEALIKLSSALDVTTDFLMSGKEIKADIINDKTMKLLIKITEGFSIKEKEQLLDYAKFIAKSNREEEVFIFNDAIDYAKYILKNYWDGELPVDVYKIAEKLKIKIYEDDLKQSGEGILLNEGNKVIIVDNSVKDITRKKFTISTLIGHAIIPWHVKSLYEIRKKGTSTLLTENIEEMEAQEFTANLIMPSEHLVKDFIKIDATIESLKKLASEKYKVSLFSLLNRLVGSAKDKYAVIQSEDGKILKAYQGNRPLVESISLDSAASTFFSKPSKEEEIRKKIIRSSCWLIDGKSDEMIIEESIYNPKYGKVLTLLTIK